MRLKKLLIFREKNLKPIISNVNNLFYIGTHMWLLSIIYTYAIKHVKNIILCKSLQMNTRDAFTQLLKIGEHQKLVISDVNTFLCSDIHFCLCTTPVLHCLKYKRSYNISNKMVQDAIIHLSTILQLNLKLRSTLIINITTYEKYGIAQKTCYVLFHGR